MYKFKKIEPKFKVAHKMNAIKLLVNSVDTVDATCIIAATVYTRHL